jgi:hypothetical protein
MASVWKTGKLSDFSIVKVPAGKSKEFNVHTFVLGLQSAGFEATFAIKTEKLQKKILKVEEFDTNIVGNMLNFMYTGQIQDKTVAMDLYNISVLYAVELLMMKAQEIILENINGSNMKLYSIYSRSY